MREGWEYRQLDDVCNVDYGTRVVQKNEKGTKFFVYGGGGATFKVDRYNREDCFIVSRFAMSPKCTRFVRGKFFLNDSGLSVSTKDNSYLRQFFVDKVLLANNDVIYSMGKGVAQKNLDVPSFKRLQIPIPPVQEQEKIVAELDCLSDVIAKKKQQLEDLDKLAQSIFYDMFGDPVTNEKGWELHPLRDIVKKMGSGATPRGGNQSYKSIGISLIRSLNVHNGCFKFDDLAFIDEAQALQLNNVKVEIDDVLLNITGASVARCCIVPKSALPARVNQHVCIIRPKQGIATPLFLCGLLITPAVQIQLIQLSKSNASTREALPKSLLEKFVIPIPPLDLQNDFARRIEVIEQQKSRIKQSISETETLFNSRMDYWFNN